MAVNGTDHSFPGYGSQMDQMLYRDVTLAEGDGLTISFNFSTNMSTLTRTPPLVFVPAGSTRTRSATRRSASVPVPLPSSDGNFISSDVAGANAPCDSFMVYVGAPVNDDDVTFSAPLFVGGNEITTVYDKQRRWFSEVLQLSGNCPSCAIVGKEIASCCGNHTPTAVSLNFGTALSGGTAGDQGRGRSDRQRWHGAHRVPCQDQPRLRRRERRQSVRGL